MDSKYDSKRVFLFSGNVFFFLGKCVGSKVSYRSMGDLPIDQTTGLWVGPGPRVKPPENCSTDDAHGRLLEESRESSRPDIFAGFFSPEEGISKKILHTGISI